jgi:hypothetical protein
MDCRASLAMTAYCLTRAYVHARALAFRASIL